MNKLKNYLEMAAPEFAKQKIGSKSVSIQLNAPTTTAFDTQNSKKDLENMSKFTRDTIVQSGRFWKNRSNGRWIFDSSTTSSGHPNHESGSAGYYGISKNKVYIFPKIAKNFKSFISDFADSIGLQAPPIKSEDSFAEEKKHMSRFNQYLEQAQSAKSLASYVIDNWKKITGLPKSEMNQEGEFPEEVLKLIDDKKVDYDEFVNEFTMLLG